LKSGYDEEEQMLQQTCERLAEVLQQCTCFCRSKTVNSGSSLKLNAFKRQWLRGKWPCSIANVWLA
jgi:hypothetical protein